MGFYDDMAAMAARLIKEKGQAGTLLEQTTTYDPATSQNTIITTTYSVQFVAFDYPTDLVDGTRVLQDDKQVYLSTKRPDGRALSVVPKPDMKLVTADGISYNLMRAKPLKPALVSVLFELQVRA